VRRVLLAAALVLGLCGPASAAPITVGTGQNGGVAIAADGTAYIGWQVNVYEPGDAVALCVLPAGARACASNVTVAFPGEGYNRQRVSVFLPAPNVVDVVVPRNLGAGVYDTFLARSSDGGRTFAPAYRISSGDFEEALPGPNGSLVLVGGPVVLHAGVVAPDGSGAASTGTGMGGYLDGVFTDAATQGQEVFTASSDASTAQAFRLPAGADPNQEASWQPIAAPQGVVPSLAGGPAGLVAMSQPTGSGGLFTQRFDGTAWSPPVVIAPSEHNDFRVVQAAGGRLTALITGFFGRRYRLHYATSTDGGVLWSSVVTVATYGARYPSALEAATTADGRGIAVIDDSQDDHALRVVRFSPRAVAVRTARFGGVRVQARSVCDSGKLRVVVEAARGSVRVAPSSVLRGARFGGARGVRRTYAKRFVAGYVVARRARIGVRVTPRSGHSRTIVLPVQPCNASA
jgi:hypothetical protein